MVNVLLQYGIDTSITNKNNLTAQAVASSLGYTVLVEMNQDYQFSCKGAVDDSQIPPHWNQPNSITNNCTIKCHVFIKRRLINGI